LIDSSEKQTVVSCISRKNASICFNIIQIRFIISSDQPNRHSTNITLIDRAIHRNFNDR